MLETKFVCFIVVLREKWRRGREGRREEERENPQPSGKMGFVSWPELKSGVGCLTY